MRAMKFLGPMAWICTLALSACGPDVPPTSNPIDTSGRGQTLHDSLGNVIVTDTVSVSIPCLDHMQLARDYVIGDDSSYYALKAIMSVDRCPDTTFPIIDFSKHTLLSKKVLTSGCCSPLFQQQIVYNDNAKRYTYRISVMRRGLCEDGIIDAHWILMPKMKADYVMTFDSAQTIQGKCP